ncbi:MAG: aspartate aminotransferase family protein, partial [Chloroflexia bacterium]|nr:aspartate aminotransferase family protein [Chloroflexia bacterium]
MVTSAPVKLGRARIEQLTGIESKRLNERTPKSGQMFERARHSMVNGFPSSYQVRA